MEKPPIPSPFEAAPVVATPSQTGNYARAFGVAVLAFIAMALLSRVVGTTIVGVVVFGAYMVMAITVTLGVQRAGKAMNWRVRPEDLPLVRRVVDANMKGAYVLMTTLWPFMLLASMNGQPFWFVPLMLFSIPSSIWSMGIEGRFKKMECEPDACDEYARLIVAWKEARFGLKK
ncbi:MAG TPA: hypothetical protein VF681_04480 [Abditibacteriaceae bacterium]|jgi:hypothetical protein